jgi:hypothetical protein
MPAPFVSLVSHIISQSGGSAWFERSPKRSSTAVEGRYFLEERDKT